MSDSINDKTSQDHLRVSFVIPTYNYGNYLPFCIKSIQQQHYQHFNIFILDDGSTDNTKEVAEVLCKRDNRIQYIQHPKNIGPVANWNSCLEKADGDLVWLISADDALHNPNILSMFVEQFDANPNLGLAFCRAQIMDNNNALVNKFIPKKPTRFPAETETTYTPDAFFPWITQANFMPVLGTVARKKCYDEITGFDPDLIHTGDWFNWLRISSRWETFYTPRAGVLYRQHQNNLSTSYENKAYPTENTLLCYQKLNTFLVNNNLSHLTPAVLLATQRFKKKHGLPLGFGEKINLKLAGWQGKLLK